MPTWLTYMAMLNGARRDKSTHYKAGTTLLNKFSSDSDLFFKISVEGAAAISPHNLFPCLSVPTIGKFFFSMPTLNLTGESTVCKILLFSSRICPVCGCSDSSYAIFPGSILICPKSWQWSEGIQTLPTQFTYCLFSPNISRWPFCCTTRPGWGSCFPSLLWLMMTTTTNIPGGRTLTNTTST